MQGLVVTTLVLCSSFFSISTALDTLHAGRSLASNQTLVSAEDNFELGFFSPGASESLYLGIWFKKPTSLTSVWVGNKATPIPKNNSTATLTLTNEGILVLVNHNRTTIWSSNTSRSVLNPVAQLLSTGNLVVRDASDSDPDNYIWQSFDYPSDTFLPGFKFGRVRATGLDRFLTSWKSPDDPSPGNYTYGLLYSGYPQLVLSHGSAIKHRVGPWNGIKFSGTPNLRVNPLYKYSFVLNDKEVYYTYWMLNTSVLSKTLVTYQGIAQRYMWVDNVRGWSLYLTGPIDFCDSYAICGAYGTCNVDNTPLCQCMAGFVPKFPEQWNRVDWSGGCVRRTSLNCSDDIFLKYSGLKIPDTQKSWFNTTMNIKECISMCKRNCSCTAYTSLDVRDGGSGCLLWFDGLLDVRQYADEVEQDIYIRMASSESVKSFGDGATGSKSKKTVPIIVAISVFLGLLILGLCVIMFVLRKKHKLKGGQDAEKEFRTKIQKENLELPLFDFTTIETATENFSSENYLGEGGFGQVYKGVLRENQEIAVKRLSKSSHQGLDEFRNEVICIAKLQHRNLVKLVGCCIQQEKILVYEYMPNKSLDFFIFDEQQRKLLNWEKQFHIINGIGRGLVYLHQDSRLRIVHRDLKASNVLLDQDMNPKISDFGLARRFGGNETEANTNRIVGTFGYMSPEYASDGLFSVKSDVYSYGVLVLEIVTGKRNRKFNHPDHNHNLLGHAWKLFKEGRSLEVADGLVENRSNRSEVSRSIHVSLLCVQQSPEDRPSMASVVLMLGSDNVLPEPKEPGFFYKREVLSQEKGFTGSSSCQQCSVNEITITSVTAR